MKSFIAMVAALALPLAVMAPARADSFAYTGSMQTYTVTETGIYSFSLTGAEGGAGHSTSPGLGAVLSGDYVLYSGQTLEIVVGQQGVNSIEMNAGGGGGGTFIYVSGSDQLVAVAGGGGGGGYYAAPGGTAQTGTTGGSSSGAGGSSGLGGAGGTATGGGNGGGGGGFSGTGGNGTGSNSGGGGGGGFSFAGGSSSYAAGGYGGGGGSGQFGGGGGGYSGGGGGGGAYPGGGGGGGGSYLNPSFTGASYAATHTGNGTAAINLVAVIVPEPSTILMLGTGMAGLAIYVGRRRRVA